MLNLLSLLLLNGTWKEDGIELQNIHTTTEIQNDGDQVLVVTLKKTYRFDALLTPGRKAKWNHFNLKTQTLVQ